MLVLEKATGRVIRVRATRKTTVLDLAVNSGSERGLLGIALHPDFPSTPQVFLYWTESTTGSDTGVLSETPLLGNRVDRFIWNGSSLTQDANIIRLRAIQEDAGQPARGNHDGGVIRIGPDRKLYVFVGDLGRRGNLQNLRCGPVNNYNCPPNAPTPDDQFGGPAPDNAHLSGVVLRLNLDGTAPADNPFFAAGAAMGGEVGANIQKVFSYGHRNSFGMAFDPDRRRPLAAGERRRQLSELNRVTAGMNGGWVQIMGQSRESRSSRRSKRRSAARTCSSCDGRRRTSPTVRRKRCRASSCSGLALRGSGVQLEMGGGARRHRLHHRPRARPAVRRRSGRRRRNALLAGGYLFRFNLTGNRRKVGVDDPRLDDRVADNVAKHEITESESLLFGSDFGVTTDIQTGPNGNLFVVSLSNGTMYEIGAVQRSQSTSPV